MLQTQTKKTCACKRWQLIGIPCVHAMFVILSQHENPFNFVDDCYKREVYMRVYSPDIYGLNGPTMWPRTNLPPIQCPQFKKQLGRLRKSRVLQSDEVRVGGRTKLRKNYSLCHCKNCNQQGNNLSSCKQPRRSTSTNERVVQEASSDQLVDVPLQSATTVQEIN